MKVYTFFTDSHRELLKIFQDNFPFSENTELNIKWFPQECKTGSFMSDGWTTTMKRKVEYILQSLKETPEGEWFVHSDCDIVLFDGWTDILERHKDNVDMMIQNDHPLLCAGFFFCKSNVNTKLLWGRVLRDLHKFEHDQVAMNFFISQMPELKVGVLPDSYFTYGAFKKGVWSGEDFVVPDASNLKMYHANWAEGVQNKKNLIENIIRQKNGL
jgi:hypothetical protein